MAKTTLKKLFKLLHPEFDNLVYLKRVTNGTHIKTKIIGKIGSDYIISYCSRYCENTDASLIDLKNKLILQLRKRKNKIDKFLESLETIH